MRIALVTDAWFPQINGVVRTLAATVAELDRRGYEVELITPARFLTVPMPNYDSIRLAVAPRFGARRILHNFKPDIVHIATEGPIGMERAFMVQGPRRAVHLGVPHAVPRLRSGSHGAERGTVLAGDAAVSRAQPGGARRDPNSG